MSEWVCDDYLSQNSERECEQGWCFRKDYWETPSGIIMFCLVLFVLGLFTIGSICWIEKKTQRSLTTFGGFLLLSLKVDLQIKLKVICSMSGVLSDLGLKEVGFVGETNNSHPIERVVNRVNLFMAQRNS